MKHQDGYSEHMKVICPKCGATLMQCVDCKITTAKVVKPIGCTEILVGATECIGVGRGIDL